MHSQVRSKPVLETAFIQSKRRKFIIKVSIVSSHKFHSRKRSKRELIDEWGYWSPRNVGRFFSVPLHELVQKFHDFIFSLYLTAETTLMEDLAVETKWPMFHNRAIFLFCGFLNAVYSFFNSFKPLFRVHLQQEQWSFTTWVNLTSVMEEGPVRPFPCAGISLTYAGVH